MRRHWRKWLAIIASMGLIGLAIVSYQRLFVGEYFLTQNSWYQIIVRDGNLGLVRVAASFLENRPEDFELEDHILGWRRVPIAGNWRWLNRIKNPMPSISLRENEFNCTMYFVATWPLLAVFVAMPCWRNRRLAGPLLREIIRPSDKSIEPRPFRRKVKRLAITLTLLFFWLSGYCWMFDYPSQISQAVHFPNSSFLHFLSTHGESPKDDLKKMRWELINSLDGSLSICYWSTRGASNPIAGWMVERFGFRMTYRYDWMSSLNSSFITTIRIFDSRRSGISRAATLATSITFPFWFPMTFCLLILYVSFLRGPWRRHKCIIENRCLRCGYNLRGLIEPRCPECGTAKAVLVNHDSSDGFL